MTILKHPLIQKYFSCKSCQCDADKGQADWHMAYRVLQAMFEPIKVGDLTLVIWEEDQIEELKSMRVDIPRFHPSYLRLPSQFQPARECECKELRKSSCRCWVGLHPCETHKCIHQPPSAVGCHIEEKVVGCPCEHCHDTCQHYQKQPCDHIGKHLGQLCPEAKPETKAVEKKIGEILKLAEFLPNGSFHKRVLELVELARKSR